MVKGFSSCMICIYIYKKLIARVFHHFIYVKLSYAHSHVYTIVCFLTAAVRSELLSSVVCVREREIKRERKKESLSLSSGRLRRSEVPSVRSPSRALTHKHSLLL